MDISKSIDKEEWLGDTLLELLEAELKHQDQNAHSEARSSSVKSRGRSYSSVAYLQSLGVEKNEETLGSGISSIFEDMPIRVKSLTLSTLNNNNHSAEPANSLQNRSTFQEMLASTKKEKPEFHRVKKKTRGKKKTTKRERKRKQLEKIMAENESLQVKPNSLKKIYKGENQGPKSEIGLEQISMAEEISEISAVEYYNARNQAKATKDTTNVRTTLARKPLLHKQAPDSPTNFGEIPSEDYGFQ